MSSTKRYYGEFLLGETNLQNNNNGNTSNSNHNSNNNDPWSSFLTLIVSFAEIYRSSMNDIEEWKKADEKTQEKVISYLTSKSKPKFNKQIKESNITTTNKEDHSAPSSIPSHITGESVGNYFKNQLLKIRNRNATKKQEDSDSDMSDNNDEDF